MKKFLNYSLTAIIALIFLETTFRFIFGNCAVAPFLLTQDMRCVGLRPNAKIPYTGWLFKLPPVIHDANAYGYRGKEYPPLKNNNTVRIGVIGDSMTYGQGVFFHEALPFQIENKLNTFSKKRYEVLNFGIPGMSIDDATKQYNYFVKKWNPDIVLFIYPMDLITRQSLCVQVRGETNILDIVYLTRLMFLPKVFFTILESFYFNISKSKSAAAKQKIYSSLESLLMNTSNNKATLLAVNLNFHASIRPNLKLFAQELGLSYLDLQDEFHKSGYTIPGEFHLNVKGNDHFSSLIAHFILEALHKQH